MDNPKDNSPEVTSRVDWHTEELAEHVPSPRQLAGIVAGTSEETAALFSSGRTLAADHTGDTTD
jgi:hypothetical protein